MAAPKKLKGDLDERVEEYLPEVVRLLVSGRLPTPSERREIDQAVEEFARRDAEFAAELAAFDDDDAATADERRRRRDALRRYAEKLVKLRRKIADDPRVDPPADEVVGDLDRLIQRIKAEVPTEKGGGQKSLDHYRSIAVETAFKLLLEHGNLEKFPSLSSKRLIEVACCLFTIATARTTSTRRMRSAARALLRPEMMGPEMVEKDWEIWWREKRAARALREGDQE